MCCRFYYSHPTYRDSTVSDILHTCSWAGESCIKEKVNRVSECPVYCVIHTLHTHILLLPTPYTYIRLPTLYIPTYVLLPYISIIYYAHPTYPSSITHTLHTCICSITLHIHNLLPPPYIPIFYYVFYYPKFP